MILIPLHQLCTDCKINKRALVEGITGYGCLCVDCFNDRIEKAKRKKKPSRKQKGLEPNPYTADEQYEGLWERMDGDAELGKWEDL
jgi:hypothetical protein